MTYRLNRDLLENLFSILRRNGRSNKKVFFGPIAVWLEKVASTLPFRIKLILMILDQLII